jgi:hypothetical protein
MASLQLVHFSLYSKTSLLRATEILFSWLLLVFSEPLYKESASIGSFRVPLRPLSDSSFLQVAHSACCLLLAWLTLWPWRWRQYIPPKR